MMLSSTGIAQKSNKILVFTKTSGFYHQSIPEGKAAIQKLGKEHHFEVDTTTDASKFNKDNLKQYAAVVFLNTTGDVLNPNRRKHLRHIFRLEMVLWVFMRLQIQNSTGPGLAI